MPVSDSWYLRSRLKMRHLELLAALDAHRNMHRAAQSIGLAQPAASKLLSDLEAALGQKLFTRHTKGVEPNEYGEVLVRRSEMILAELRGAGEELTGLRSGDMGSVAIGTIDAATVDHVVPAIERTQGAHPRLQVSVKVGTSDILMSDILSGALEFAVAHLEDVAGLPDVHYQPLSYERLSLICRRGHPLTSRSRVTPHDIQSVAWVMKPPGSRHRQAMEGMFHAEQLPVPETIISTGSVIITFAYLAKTDALSAVSSSLAQALQKLGHMAILPLSEELKSEDFGLVQLRHRRLSAGARLLREAIEQHSTT